MRRITAVLAILALPLAACAGQEGSGSGDTVTLRVATPAAGPEHFNSVSLIAYLDAVKEASDGRIDYEMFYGGALVPPAEIGGALKDGTVDVGQVLASYKPELYPASNWISQAAVVGSHGAPGSVFEKSAANIEWWWTEDGARKGDWEDNGIVPALPGATPSAPYQLLCRDQVTSLDDARGRTVKTSGTFEAEAVAALGMKSTTVPAAETFEALQRGLVDCVLNNPGAIADNSFWEVAHHLTTVDFPPFMTWGLFFSQDLWDRLPDDLQTIMWEHLPAYLKAEMDSAMRIEKNFYENADEHGVRLHAPEADLAAAIDEHVEKTLAALPDEAPGTVADGGAALDRYVAAHQEWKALLADELGLGSDAAWAQWVGSATTEVDTGAYAELVYDRVLADRMP